MASASPVNHVARTAIGGADGRREDALASIGTALAGPAPADLREDEDL